MLELQFGDGLLTAQGGLTVADLAQPTKGVRLNVGCLRQPGFISFLSV